MQDSWMSNKFIYYDSLSLLIESNNAMKRYHWYENKLHSQLRNGNKTKAETLIDCQVFSDMQVSLIVWC